ncbi:sulfatase [Nocardioides lentus]|uniref:Sulfatase n=1 Tax=Nocardioides lentus TaxID=338077 RepID=A0ABP5AD33_9ACTN
MGRTRRRLAVAAVVGLLACAPALVLTSPGSGSDEEPDARVAQGAVEPPPNVVLVLADDLGWGDLGTGLVNGGEGNPLVHTPAIDRLAAEGAVFDHAYAGPNCSPTRMALLTGMAAPRPDNNVFLVGGLDRGGDRELVGPPQGRQDDRLVLPDDAVTLGEAMQGAGYATSWTGKFHVTRFAEDVVSDHGFDLNLGGTRAGVVGQYHAQGQEFDRTVFRSLDPWAGDYTREYVDEVVAPFSPDSAAADLDALVGTRKHLTDAVADATLAAIDAQAAQPFLAVMSHYAVHTPVGPAQPRRDLMAALDRRAARDDRWTTAEPTSDGEWRGRPGTRPSYAALLEGMDQTVGRLVDHLESTPDPRRPGEVLADNTVVVLVSDNGGRTDVGGRNRPLRGQKGELDEGGVRVPWIVWSGDEDLVAGGTVNPTPVDVTDLYPTFLDWADHQMPARVTPDGASLTRAVATGETVPRARFAHLPGYLLAKGRDQRPESAVWRARWKLRYTYEDRRFRLYDVTDDPGETTDLAARRPELVAELGEVLLEWLEETDAPLATLRRDSAPLRFTVRGAMYSDGRVESSSRPREVVVRAGEEVPFVLDPVGAERR